MDFSDEALPAGTTLFDGRFTIQELIGRGGFGLTYKATDSDQAEGIVVLKEFFPLKQGVRQGKSIVFPAAIPYGPGPSALVVAEARRQEKLRHPCVARTIYTFSENNTAYIAMEWIDGDTLLGLREKGPLGEELLVRVYLTVLDAIFHFAQNDLAHRDLNPRNIMVRRADGMPVVIDFGLARPIGPGNTLLSRTAAGVPGLRPPEQYTRHSYQDVWTDIYTLSASLAALILNALPDRAAHDQLMDLKRRKVAEIKKYGDGLLRCLDKGMAVNITQRLRTGQEALDLLGINTSDLERILGPAVFAGTLLLTDIDRLRYGSVKTGGKLERPTSLYRQPRFQRALLQSFDTARFQPSSVIAPDGAKLDVPNVAKIALARTEAVLNILFGREIIVPAGQVAESPAFISLFKEMMYPYLSHFQERIDTACTAARLPSFRPFRLALEEREMVDYVGFVHRYKYTGAPVLLLQSSGRGGEEEEEKRRAEQMEHVKRLFINEDYAALEAAVHQEGYAEFARQVRAYFTSENSVVARRDIPPVNANEYALVFYRRLTDDELSGEGLSEARASLELVEEIEADLDQAGVAGYRGNWYLFAEKFKHVWPLARAYLDTRLFITLARQYEIDHPILISQEFEYGRFDHSLFLGPKFAEQVGEGDRSNLLEITSRMGHPIDWIPIFELFFDPEFLRSLRRMNDFYFSREPSSEDDYLDMINAHGGILERKLKGALAFGRTEGQLTVQTAGDASGGALSYQSYDPVGGSAGVKERDRMAAESYLGPFGSTPQDHTAIRLLPVDRGGHARGPGDWASRQILHYYAKPYSLLVREDL